MALVVPEEGKTLCPPVVVNIDILKFCTVLLLHSTSALRREMMAHIPFVQDGLNGSLRLQAVVH